MILCGRQKVYSHSQHIYNSKLNKTPRESTWSKAGGVHSDRWRQMSETSVLTLSYLSLIITTIPSTKCSKMSFWVILNVKGIENTILIKILNEISKTLHHIMTNIQLKPISVCDSCHRKSLSLALSHSTSLSPSKSCYEIFHSKRPSCIPVSA